MLKQEIAAMKKVGIPNMDIVKAVKEIIFGIDTNHLPNAAEYTFTKDTISVWDDRDLMIGENYSLSSAASKVPENVELPEFSYYKKGNDRIYFLTILEPTDELYSKYQRIFKCKN